MDILRIQDLIKEGRIVNLSDIDATKAYLQFGLYQNGNRANNASNADAYKSYVIPISELIGGPPTPPFVVQNKNFIGVDPIYGNDAQAVTDGVYNPNSAFKSVDSAIANAQPGDTVVLYPGSHCTFGINNPVCNFYAFPGASLAHCFGGTIFSISAGNTLYVDGSLEIIGTSISFINIGGAGSSAIIKCKNIVFNGVFFGVTVTNGAKLELTCSEIDARNNFANAFLIDIGAEAIINADIVRFSWIAYLVGSDSTVIANVAKTIQHDLVGDFTQLGNTFALVANGATNATIKINGDLYDEKTIDPMSPSGGALNFQNGAGGIMILNGHRSYVNQLIGLRIANSAAGEIILNSEMINTYVNGSGGSSGLGAYLDSGVIRIKNKLQTVGGAPTDPCIQYNGGILILDDAVIIANAGAESIAAVAPITYKCYTGFTNNAPNANATNAIAATTLVVDSLIQ